MFYSINYNHWGAAKQWWVWLGALPACPPAGLPACLPPPPYRAPLWRLPHYCCCCCCCCCRYGVPGWAAAKFEAAFKAALPDQASRR